MKKEQIVEEKKEEWFCDICGELCTEPYHQCDGCGRDFCKKHINQGNYPLVTSTRSESQSYTNPTVQRTNYFHSKMYHYVQLGVYYGIYRHLLWLITVFQKSAIYYFTQFHYFWLSVLQRYPTLIMQIYHC